LIPALYTRGRLRNAMVRGYKPCAPRPLKAGVGMSGRRLAARSRATAGMRSRESVAHALQNARLPVPDVHHAIQPNTVIPN